MKGLLREVNELGERLEKGEKDLLLMNAGSHSAGVGTGREEFNLPARAGVSAVSLQAESSAELYGVGLLQSLQDWNCSGTHPLVAGRDKSQHKPVWPLVLCAHSFVFSEHPSLGCTTCAFLHLHPSSFCLCSAWICSVCLANSQTLPYLNLVLSVFILYFSYGL